MVKNFEKIFYKFYNYPIFLIIFFLYSSDYNISENFLVIIIFLYLRDICFNNIFISELFLKNFKLLKDNTEFFCLIYKSSIILLIGCFFIITLLKIFSDISFFKNIALYIIPFVIFNSILLLLIKKNLFKIDITIITLLILSYTFHFQSNEIEALLLFICIFEFILITFFSNINFSKIKKVYPFGDMRFYFFFKKFLINVIISDFYKLIFLTTIIFYYFLGNVSNLRIVFILIFMIEIGDLFSFMIKNKFFKTLENNNKIQKKNDKIFRKIFNFITFYFINIIIIFFLFLLNSNIEIKFLICFALIFLFYNLEKLRNLIFFTREEIIPYKKKFLYNMTITLLTIIFLRTNLDLNNSILLDDFNILIIYLGIFEFVYFYVIKKYIII
jgi:hypothetical protein